MVKTDTMAMEWTSEESLRLLTLFETHIEWPLCAQKLNDEFASKRPSCFFTANSCKEEFERIMSTGHPEHFLRQKGDKYSQNELVKAWIAYMEKRVKADTARQTEMLLVKMREKAEIFNRIFSEENPLPDEEIARLLEEARFEDSKRDPEVVNREVAAGMEKIAELQALHEADPEKYPPLRIIIPPSRPSTSSAAPFSPIKPLFDGLTPPSTVGDPKAEVAALKPSPSTGMSLRSASHSPQKTSFASSQESKAAIQQETHIRSPQRHTSGASQKTVTESLQKENPISPQKAGSGSMQKVGTGSSQKSGRITPSGSPQRPAALIGSPRSSIGSPRRLILPVEQMTQKDSTVKMELDEGERIMEIDTTPTHANEVTPGVGVSNVDDGKMEVHHEGHIQTRQTRSSTESSGGTGITLAKTDERSIEKRQLRNLNKVTSQPDSSSNRPVLRPQRLSPRKSSAEMTLRSETDTAKGQTHVPELRSRRGSTSGQAVEPIVADGPPSQSLRSRRIVEKSEESEDPSHQRRRSERRRGVDSSISAGEVTPTRRKRAHEAEETVDGGRSDEEGIRGPGIKKRKLSFRDTAISSEAIEKQEGAKIVESRMEVQSSPEPDKDERAVRRTEESIMTEMDGEKQSSRRGSLRSANIRDQESKKEETADGVKESLETTAVCPKQQDSNEMVVVESDSDEDKPLGDIRSGIMAAKREEEGTSRSGEKLGETRFQRATQSEKVKKRSLEKHRGRPRRERSSGEGTLRMKSEASRTPALSTRRHSRKEELDETNIEQKAFMTSVWRMVSSHRHAAIFAQPVSDSIARGYSKVVRNRMDLGTLKKQLDSGKVADMTEFKRRLLLMFANAVMFNSTGHDVNNYAKEMAADSLSSLKAMQNDILNMKEGAHITRSAAAAEEASLERRKRVSYLTVTSTTSLEKGETKEKEHEKEKRIERDKEAGKEKETEKEKGEEVRENIVEESSMNGESNKKQLLVRQLRGTTQK